MRRLHFPDNTRIVNKYKAFLFVNGAESPHIAISNKTNFNVFKSIPTRLAQTSLSGPSPDESASKVAQLSSAPIGTTASKTSCGTNIEHMRSIGKPVSGFHIGMLAL